MDLKMQLLIFVIRKIKCENRGLNKIQFYLNIKPRRAYIKRKITLFYNQTSTYSLSLPAAALLFFFLWLVSQLSLPLIEGTGVIFSIGISYLMAAIY
jgi:hypothetical protein